MFVKITSVTADTIKTAAEQIRLRVNHLAAEHLGRIFTTTADAELLATVGEVIEAVLVDERVSWVKSILEEGHKTALAHTAELQAERERLIEFEKYAAELRAECEWWRERYPVETHGSFTECRACSGTAGSPEELPTLHDDDCPHARPLPALPNEHKQ